MVGGGWWGNLLGDDSGHYGQSYIKEYPFGDRGANVNNIKPEEYRRFTLSFHQEYGKSYC